MLFIVFAAFAILREECGLLSFALATKQFRRNEKRNQKLTKKKTNFFRPIDRFKELTNLDRESPPGNLFWRIWLPLPAVRRNLPSQIHSIWREEEKLPARQNGTKERILFGSRPERGRERAFAEIKI